MTESTDERAELIAEFPELAGRPCQICVAGWAEPSIKSPPADWMPPVPDPQDCEVTHRDDPRVFALARAMATEMQQPEPTDAQVWYFLEDADEVVDDFDPAPETWVVEKLPDGKDSFGEVDAWLRINGVDYVALAGEKCRGQLVTAEDWRSWHDDELDDEDEGDDEDE
ncbi:MAG TPA: hypothetical protein VFC19_49355 [Candidatus Limnocylindrales bacterium]|nr:hypothetical protein [Candidatus Limnocylindrales bacterium]